MNLTYSQKNTEKCSEHFLKLLFYSDHQPKDSSFSARNDKEKHQILTFKSLLRDKAKLSKELSINILSND